MSNNLLNLVKNVDLTRVVTFVQQGYIMSTNFYQQNKQSVDLALFAISFLLVMLNVIDLSVISKLYFLGLIYMTVVLLGNFYNQLHNPTNLQEGIASLDNITSKQSLNEFVT